MVLEGALDHEIGAGERSIGRCFVAEREIETLVARDLIPNLRSIGFERIDGVDDGAQRFVVDVDEFHGIPRLGRRFGDDDGHGFAGMPRAVVRQRQLGNVGNRRCAFGRNETGALPLDRVGRVRYVRDGAMAVGEIVGSGQHGNDAGCGKRGLDMNRPDARVRVGRADEGGVRRSGHPHVIGVAAGSRDEAFVFETRERCADVFRQARFLSGGRTRPARALRRGARPPRDSPDCPAMRSCARRLHTRRSRRLYRRTLL